MYGGIVRTERSEGGEEMAKSLLKGMDKKGQSESTNSLKGVVRKQRELPIVDNIEIKTENDKRLYNIYGVIKPAQRKRKEKKKKGGTSQIGLKIDSPIF